MIRKSHSWSLAWIRDRSANQSGPSIVSLSSGQSQSRPSRHLQAHRADAGNTSHFGPRILYFSRSVRIPFAIVRVLFAIIRISSRTFAIIRDIFTPPPPRAAQIRTPKSAFRNKFYAAPMPLSTIPHSTSVHERSGSVHEHSLNVQPFFHPPSPQAEPKSALRIPKSAVLSPSPQACRSLCRNLYRKLCRTTLVLQFPTSPVAMSRSCLSGSFWFFHDLSRSFRTPQGEPKSQGPYGE